VSSLNQLAEGLARRCGTISGLNCYPVMHPSPTPPAACVRGPVRWTYDETMEGYWRPVFEVWVIVMDSDLYRAQQGLSTYLAPTGTRSLPAAIHGDPTLGGVANSTRVIGGAQPPLEVQVAGGRQLQAALEVEVLAM